jgi:two-component system NtrC family sensor kinase
MRPSNKRQRQHEARKIFLEQELKASEERYRSLFERVAHGIIISTREGSVVDCNQALLDMLGYNSKNEFLSIDIENDLYMEPGDRKKFQQDIEQRGYVKDYHVNFRKKTEEIVSVQMTISPRYDMKKDIIGYQGIIIDITEREKMERDLQAATKKFQKITEMGEDAIMVLNQDSRIEFANSLSAVITGYNQVELIGMNFNLLLREREQNILAELHSKLGEDENRRVCMETQIKTADDKTMDVDICITIAKNEEGKVKTYTYMRDISQRIGMERRIREANEFLSKLIDSTVDSIVVTDMSGNILIFNRGAEELLGYKAEEVIGKMNIKNIYLPGMAKELMGKLRSPDYSGVGRLRSMPMVHKNKCGEMIEGSISASIIYDGEGNEVATIGIFTDLRRRFTMEKRLRETEQQLLQSEKLAAMGRLTAQIAHELYNPIYGIMNTLELLKTEISPSNKRRRILEMALSETERITEMLSNMLSFSKPQEEARKDIDINKLMKDIMLVHEKNLFESNIAIEFSLDPELPTVKASPNQIIQVILNIISNAKDAMSDGGTLTIVTSNIESDISIRISDTGTGIPENIRDRIFDAFFTTKQAVKGVGLGLSVCYGIVKDHEGEIQVESEAGKGTSISILLPKG